MKLAISPCPNDTFLYEHFAHQLLAESGEVLFCDIAELNAFHDHPTPPDVIKVSCASAPLFLDRYRLLPAGGAFADAVGPLVLRKSQNLPWNTTLLPGWRTSAHILFRFWQESQGLPKSQEHFARFDGICAAVANAEYDAGVVIHESRFTYGDLDLTSIVDLGVFWETQTNLPVPLGCTLIRRDLPEATVRQVLDGIRESIAHAWSRSEALTPWISEHADEMAPQVQRDHIATYVTARSLDCGSEGLEALRVLWNCAERLVAPWPKSAVERDAALVETRSLLKA